MLAKSRGWTLRQKRFGEAEKNVGRILVGYTRIQPDGSSPQPSPPTPSRSGKGGAKSPYVILDKAACLGQLYGGKVFVQQLACSYVLGSDEKPLVPVY